MKPTLLVGILLIAVGVICLAYPAFHYTKREQVLKLGPVEATAETRHSVPIPPAVSWVLVVAGVGLVAVGVTRGSKGRA